MADERKRMVAQAYDALVDDYLVWSAQGGKRDQPDTRLARFMDVLPEGAAVLDLGCGAGIPTTRLLAERFRVTGVDVSAAQLKAARRNVPEARFIQADIATVHLLEESFDGVSALFSIIHVPREEHAALFSRIRAWLRPGGYFLATLGANDGPDWTGDWLGQPMFFSSYDAPTNRRLLREVGFELLIDEVSEVQEPEGPVPFLWVLARA